MRSFQTQPEAKEACFSHTSVACSAYRGTNPKTKSGMRRSMQDMMRERDAYNGDVSEIDESMHSPLISQHTTSYDNTMSPHGFRGSSYNNRVRQEIHLQSGHAEAGESTSIGSGWHLAWKWKEGEGSFKRIFLHEDGATGSWRDSLDGEFTKAAGLVSQPALCKKRLMDQCPVGPAMVHPSTIAEKGTHWKDLFEPGVKHALLVGMGIQIFQQLLGTNAVLYYTPRILEQAGVQVLLSNMGISPKSSSLLISVVMTLLMLTCVVIAMRLMDVSGRRSLLLNTNPVLTASLTTLVIVRVVHMSSIVKATVSTASVISYSCFFAMGFGPIPNILCAEIFPMSVGGVCIAICSLTSWICSIIVTYTLSVMLSSIGLPGVFSIYAAASIVSWAFVYFKVPETKGMPLEVIIYLFDVGAKHRTAADRTNNYS
ncbi:trans-aconitate methyltransferase 2 [Orobanche gracilis]